ncbi:MAG: hypothetical protein AB7O52_02095 [Planctomycetota bacterium]
MVVNLAKRVSCALALSFLALGPVSGQADVIVGDLHDLNNYGSAGEFFAYSVGTVSCNIGTVPLNWIANNAQHPVIGQNLYRLKDGRFEQVGQSWLKHGFTALQQSLCQPCVANPNGSALGVGCSDPYSAGLNGSQNNGPKSEVNATTGVFPFPYVFDPPVTDLTSRRVRVHADDVDPAQNVGATYWVEGQYVTLDDATANNHHNNASYRRVNVGANPANFPLSFVAGQATVREKPAIEAWPLLDPTVQLTQVTVNNGRFYLASKVTQLPTGNYSYEYALFNLNSDRSAGSFTVPLGPSLLVTNVGFHDVPYHSGLETVYDQADWTSNVTAAEITWSCTPFAANPNANALRWATMYNYRFVTNAAPIAGQVTLGLFKPGNPAFALIDTQVPDGSAVVGVSALVCANTGSGVDLSWTNSDVYDQIQVLRDGTLVATLPGTATTFSEGLPDASYVFGIRAFIGADFSPLVSCNVQVGLTHTLSLLNANAVAGQTNLRIPLRGGSIAFIDGFSASISYATDLLDGVAVDFVGSAPAAAGADFMMADVGVNYMTLEVLLDSVAPFSGNELPAGFNQTFATLVFAVTGTFADGETRQLTFVDGLGAGVLNEFVDNGAPITPFTMGATVTFVNAATFVRGDCNSDGSVNIPDVIFLLNYLFAFGLSPSCFSSCDVDDNGSLQLPDAIVALNYLFAGGSPPVSPFPTAGTDPTPDTLPCI